MSQKTHRACSTHFDFPETRDYRELEVSFPHWNSCTHLGDMSATIPFCGGFDLNFPRIISLVTANDDLHSHGQARCAIRCRNRVHRICRALIRDTVSIPYYHHAALSDAHTEFRITRTAGWCLVRQQRSSCAHLYTAQWQRAQQRVRISAVIKPVSLR